MAKTRSGCLPTLVVWGLVGTLGAYIAGETRIRNFVDNKAVPYVKETVIPGTKKFFSEKADGKSNSVSPSNGLVDRVIDGAKDLIKPDPNPQSMQYSDGTKIEPWNYHGNTWPQEWPTTNSDGSYNQDYMKWYMRQNSFPRK